MKILLINLHSSRNAGDAVLTDVSVQQLLDGFPGAEVVLAMNDPASYSSGPGKPVESFMAWLKEGRRWRWWLFPLFVWAVVVSLSTYRLLGRPIYPLVPRRWRPLLAAYFSADLVASCAGNFLYSSGRLGLPYLISIFTMAFALLAGKPLYMLPQTIGPLRRNWERRLLGLAARRMQLAFARDAASRELLLEAGVSAEKCRLVPDVAFVYEPAPAAAGRELLLGYGVDPEIDRPLLGLTALDWGAQNRLFHGQEVYEQALAAAVRHFVQEYEGCVILFSQVQGPTEAEDDRRTAGRIYRRLEDLQERVFYIDGIVPPDVLRAAYGQVDLFIGTRLHSNIFALSEGVPVAAVQYQPKTRGIMEMLGLAEWVIEIEKVDGPAVTALLDRLWQERETYRRQLAEVMPGILRQAGGVGREIAADFAEAS